MSGDGAGVIFGALLLTATLPIVLTAGAVVATAVGIGKLGKVAHSVAIEHHNKVQLEVHECSVELSGFYRRLEATIAKRDRMGDAFYKSLDVQLSKAEFDMKQSVSSGKTDSIPVAERMLRDARDETSRALVILGKDELERIRHETKAETELILAELRNAQQIRVEAANWRQTTAAAQAQHIVLLNSLLRDAKASVKLIHTMANSDGDPSFSAKVAVLENSLATAEESLASGLVEVAATSAQQIITRSASLALEHEQMRSERDFMRAAVRGRLEGLKAELEVLEWMDFVDERFGHVTENMDDFTQGAFTLLMDEIDGEIEAIAGSQGHLLSCDALELKLQSFENELVPRVNQVAQSGHARLIKFYERLHALSILEQHMREQGYKCDWKQMVGGDVTQKAVAHFTEPITGNSIAISLDDADSEAAELDRMAIEVMFYYAKGRVVTEPEKQRIRTGMISALETEGLCGHVDCAGSVGAESANQTMRERASVESQVVRKLKI